MTLPTTKKNAMMKEGMIISPISRDNLYLDCAQEVFDYIGPGHQEVVYSKALQREFKLRNIDYQDETVIPIKYKGADVGYVRTDITILDNGNDDGFCPIIELKAICNKPTDVQLQQLINYLKLTDKQEGYLINFPQPSSAISKTTRSKVDVIKIERSGKI